MKYKPSETVPMRVAKFVLCGSTEINDVEELSCIIALLAKHLTETSYHIEDYGNSKYRITAVVPARRE